MPEGLLIKGGRVLDPASNLDEICDVFIKKGKVRKIARNINLSYSELIDASDKIVIPGLIDMHVHFREPGREDEETIESGSRAAARGGFTTVCCMPNTDPPIDDPSLVKFIYEQAKSKGVVEVLPVATITKNREGEELSPMGRLKEAGAIAFSDDGSWVTNSALMRRALEYVKMLSLPIISHCEDKSLSAEGVMNEGYFSTVNGLAGIPREAEEIAIFRDLALAKMTDSSLHLAHVSTANSVRLIRKAKNTGIKVTAEVTPHHLAISDEGITDFNTNTKVSPPFRGKEDIELLKESLRDNTIDVIATDHAPHTVEEKERDYEEAPFGIIGLETALSLVLREVVEKKVLSLMQAISRLTVNPARILGIDRGEIREEVKANITIFDPGKSWLVREEEFLSQSSNSPFLGWELPGKVEWTIIGGKVVYRSEK
jgi:dihydroorotase